MARRSPPPLKQHHSVLTFGTSSSHVTICQMRRLFSIARGRRWTDLELVEKFPQVQPGAKTCDIVSERVAIGKHVRERLGERQGQRTDLELPGNFPEVERGRETRDIATERAGFERNRKLSADRGTVSLWNLLDQAVDQQISDQRNLVAWWNKHVSVRHRPGRGGVKLAADRALIPRDRAEKISGMPTKKFAAGVRLSPVITRNITICSAGHPIARPWARMSGSRQSNIGDGPGGQERRLGGAR
jgi:hypothetical protein